MDIPPPREDPVEPVPAHPLHPDVVRPARRDRRGITGPTKAQARGPRWRKTSHGLYVRATVDRDVVEQRICEAAAVLPAASSGVTGWAALRWSGATYFSGLRGDGRTELPVPLAVLYSDIRPQAGLLVTSERLPPRDLTVHDNLAITTHVRSVGFEMRYAANAREAAIHLSMAARDDLVSIEEMALYVYTLNGWIGVPQCRAGIALANENCWSPTEVEMLLHWEIDADFPGALCNQPIFDLNGRHIGTPDLVDVEAGVVGQYDGALHLEGRRRAKDLASEHAYRRVGLEHFTMVAADRHAPEISIIPRMIETRARARFEPESTRTWTVVPPPWWISTTTVAARRALTEQQRTRLLRYRAG